MTGSRPWSRHLKSTFVLLVLASAADCEVRTVSIGEGREMNWLGAGTLPIQTIAALHRAGDDPNDLVPGNTPANLLELQSERRPGSMHLLEFTVEENIAAGAIERGGGIDAPNVFGEEEGFGFAGGLSRESLKSLILPELLDDTSDGGELRAFERKNLQNGIFGIIIVLDLGGRFGVNKIRFYPRNTVHPSPTTPFQDDYMRAFDISINNGVDLTQGGNPAWRGLVSETDNRNPVVEIQIDPPEVIRHVRLQSQTPINWEIDEIEVLGHGFVTTGRYISDIFDAGEPSAWTNLRWDEEIVGEPALSAMVIRTRTGNDDSPFVFTRKLKGKPDAEEVRYAINSRTEEMDLSGYENLPAADDQGRQWEPGGIHDDLVDWSPFKFTLS